MLTEYVVRRGFSGKRVKEYFIVQVDVDTIGGLVAGPFETQEQCAQVIDALRPMYNRRLSWIAGHQSAQDWQGIGR